MRFRRHHQHRLPTRRREAISNRMLFPVSLCMYEMKTIITSYDRSGSNERLSALHTNVKSALVESVFRPSSPIPKRLSVADCP